MRGAARRTRPAVLLAAARLLGGLALALAGAGCAAAPEPAATTAERPADAEVDATTVPAPRPVQARAGSGGDEDGARSPLAPSHGEEPMRESAWPERPHGRDPGGAASGSAGVRFDPPARRDPRAPGGPLPDRPRLGLVVVRGGVIVHDPAVLLDLEARLGGEVAALVALEPPDRASVGLEGLARVGRARGLDLVLVDVRAAARDRDAAGAAGVASAPPEPEAAREAWLVSAATRDLVGAFLERASGTTGAPPASGLEVAVRIERAWRALP